MPYPFEPSLVLAGIVVALGATLPFHSAGGGRPDRCLWRARQSGGRLSTDYRPDVRKVKHTALIP